MVKQSGGTLAIACNGGCGKTLKVPVPVGLLVRKVDISCTECGKDTKWSLEAKKAENAGIIPAGQRTLTKEEDD